MQNRRRFPRFDMTFQLKYAPAKKRTQFGYTISEDVSKGGLCIPAIDGIAKIGELLKLDINKRDGGDNILATGKVRWVKKIKRKALLNAEAGIEFIDIDQTDLDRLITPR